MGRVTSFMLITLDGYFEGPERDISWHQHDAEGSGFAMEGLKSGNTLLFGRVTYELMAGYWPTPHAASNDPVVAKGMNNAEKIVFSRTLTKAGWNRASLVKGNIEEEIKKLKQTPGRNMTLLGSGSILTQLAQKGLIDDYQFMVVPVLLGNGTPIFKGIHSRLKLRLTSTRTFKNGNVLLCYQPVEKA
jgi:dihydrofolate reductase